MSCLFSSCSGGFNVADDLNSRLISKYANEPVFNTKVKLYSDGTQDFCYSDFPIFRRSVPRSPDNFFVDLKYSNCFYKMQRESEILRYQHNKIMHDIDVYYKSVDNYLLMCRQSRLFDKQLIHDSLVRDGFIENAVDLAKSIRNSIRQDYIKFVRDSIFDLVLSNDWQYFFTGTIDPKKLDSSDPSALKKPLQKWLNNIHERYGVSYLLIFERHKKSDGIHIHGLLNSDKPLKLVDSGTKSYYGFKRPLKDKTALSYGLDVSKGKTVYNLKTWRFGWSTAIKVYGSRGALSNYVTKYITKDNDKIMGRYYWHSRDLKKPQVGYYNSNYDDLALPSFHGLKYLYVPADNNTFISCQDDNGYTEFLLDDI